MIPGVTGVLADASGSVDALTAALETCLRTTFDPAVIRSHAERFSRAAFQQGFAAAVAGAIAARRAAA